MSEPILKRERIGSARGRQRLNVYQLSSSISLANRTSTSQVSRDSPTAPFETSEPLANNDHSEQALRDKIDARLQFLDKEARDLRTQRNQLAPISRLPPEIFSIIAQHCIPYSFSLPSQKDVDEEVLSFGLIYGMHMTLSSVCRSWRNLVLGDHRLWAMLIISDAYLDLAPELINRSGAIPLSVFLQLSGSFSTCPDELISSSLELIAEQRHRIRHLNIILSSYSIQDWRVSVLWEPAPILESCTLSWGGFVPPVGRSLFAGSAPRLASIKFCEVESSWDLLSLPSLSSVNHLEILNPDNRPTYQQLYIVLSALPNLQRLTFENALPTPTGDNHPIPETLKESVITVDLKGTSSEIHTFLDWASFEHTQHFNLTFFDGNAHLAQQSVTTISKPCNERGPITQIFLSEYREASYTINVSYNHTRPGHGVWQHIRLKWIHIGNTPLLKGFICGVIKLLPLSHCKNFICHESLTPEDWSECVRHMPQLEALCVTGREGLQCTNLFEPLLEALKAWPAPTSLGKQKHRTASAQDVPFPKLMRVEVDATCIERWWKRLVVWLQERKDANCALDDVVVWRASKHPTLAHILALKEGAEELGTVRRFWVK
ncbi:hypothetical protein AX16_005849 [Volvariella volvacea WC 439]|nr:hypothetical protein AX16_005849 [Volvariella volvacea WC 439]